MRRRRRRRRRGNVSTRRGGGPCRRALHFRRPCAPSAAAGYCRPAATAASAPECPASCRPISESGRVPRGRVAKLTSRGDASYQVTVETPHIKRRLISSGSSKLTSVRISPATCMNEHTSMNARAAHPAVGVPVTPSCCCCCCWAPAAAPAACWKRGWFRFAPGSRVSGLALVAGAGGGLEDRTMGRMLPWETSTHLRRGARVTSESRWAQSVAQWPNAQQTHPCHSASVSMSQELSKRVHVAGGHDTAGTRDAATAEQLGTIMRLQENSSSTEQGTLRKPRMR